MDGGHGVLEGSSVVAAALARAGWPCLVVGDVGAANAASRRRGGLRPSGDQVAPAAKKQLRLATTVSCRRMGSQGAKPAAGQVRRSMT